MTTDTRPHLLGYFRDQMRTPVTTIGGFFRMCVLTAKALFTWPFQWHEFILHTQGYQNWCKAAFGGMLHHSPAEILRTDKKFLVVSIV